LVERLRSDVTLPFRIGFMRKEVGYLGPLHPGLWFAWGNAHNTTVGIDDFDFFAVLEPTACVFE
jgi:hypothetical protein